VSRKYHPATVFRKAGAVLLCAFVLLLAALAASPSLHEWLHHDANEEGHECAVTLFLHGKVDTTTLAPVVAAAFVLFGGIALLVETLVLSSVEYHFCPSRAPPR
jgi:hypothetical protein